MDDPLSKILVVFFFVFLNGFFVAAEFAIVTAPRGRIDELARGGNWRARAAKHVIDRLDAYLSACQLGITLASLALGWIGEPFLARLLLPLFHTAGIESAAALHTVSFVVAFSTISFLHIVFGEMAPKSFAIRKSTGVAMNSALPLSLFFYAFYPFIWVMNEAAMLSLRLVGVSGDDMETHVHSEAELRAMLNRSAANGELTAQETDMVEKVFDFHDREAHQIMVPRPDIVYLDVENDAGESLKIVEKCGFTRFPLCEGSVDRVIGLVNVKDLYRATRRANGQSVDVRSLRRDILFFPEHNPISTILREFQSRQVHLGIVLDEYGGTLGLVTLEDVIEELVGEIQDEFDREVPSVRRVGPNEYLVEGGCPISEFEEATGLTLPDTGADTVAGVVLDAAGDLPDEGERMPIPGGVLVVEAVEEQRITSIRLVRTSGEEIEKEERAT